MRHINLLSRAGLLLIASTSHLVSAKTTDDVSNYREKISAGITQFEETRREDWSYQVERFENEEGDVTSSIERFDPTTNWTLVKLNGSHPSQDAVEKYQKKNQRESKDNNKGSNHSFRLRDIIDLDSLTLIDEGPQLLRMGFDVNIKRLGEDAAGKLDGVLHYDKNKGFVESILITNNDSFSPMFSSTIDKLKLRFKFIRIDDAVLPVENAMDMQGSFAFFTEIDETSLDTYSQYSKK